MRRKQKADLVDLAHDAAEALRRHQPGLSMRMRRVAEALYHRHQE